MDMKKKLLPVPPRGGGLNPAPKLLPWIPHCMRSQFTSKSLPCYSNHINLHL